MQFLITSDSNGFEGHDPLAYLTSWPYEIKEEVLFEILKVLENKQLGIGRHGGSIKELCTDVQKYFRVNMTVLEKGRKSEFKDKKFPEYKLVSGNY